MPDMERRTADEWVAYLTDDQAQLTLDEFGKREQFYQVVYAKAQYEAMVGTEQQPRGLLWWCWRIDHVLQRIWGSTERQEIYYHRQDPRYPLGQLDDPGYLDVRRLIDHWEDRKAELGRGGQGMLGEPERTGAP